MCREARQPCHAGGADRDGIPIAPALMRGLDQVASDLGIAKLV